MALQAASSRSHKLIWPRFGHVHCCVVRHCRRPPCSLLIKLPVPLLFVLCYCRVDLSSRVGLVDAFQWKIVNPFPTLLALSHTHTRAVKNFRCEHKLFCRSGRTWPDDDQYYKPGARRCFTILLTSHSCFRGSKSGSRLLQEEALLQPWRGSRMRQKSWGPVKWVADDIIFHGGGVWRWWWWRRKGSEIVMEGMSAGGQGKLFTAFCRLCEFVSVNMATAVEL